METTKETWRAADAVCLDVDSTLCQDEGIDELAKFAGVFDAVSAWTNKAMSGNVTFQESLKARLGIIKPTQQMVDDFLAKTPAKVTPGMPELVKKLRERGADVFLVSGGFHDLVDPRATDLGIPLDHVYANRFQYDEAGECTGFDANEPTSATGGKARVAELLKSRYNHSNLVFVGDGATDMEACPPADAFIGFGANVVRASVREKASWFVMSVQELMDEL